VAGPGATPRIPPPGAPPVPGGIPPLASSAEGPPPLEHSLTSPFPWPLVGFLPRLSLREGEPLLEREIVQLSAWLPSPIPGGTRYWFRLGLGRPIFVHPIHLIIFVSPHPHRPSIIRAPYTVLRFDFLCLLMTIFILLLSFHISCLCWGSWRDPFTRPLLLLLTSTWSHGGPTPLQFRIWSQRFGRRGYRSRFLLQPCRDRLRALPFSRGLRGRSPNVVLRSSARTHHYYCGRE